jgi:hypothetical protein
MKENDMQTDPLLEDIVSRALNDPIDLAAPLGWADVEERARIRTRRPHVTLAPRLRSLRPRVNTTKQRWTFRASLAAGVAVAAAATVLFVPGNHPTLLQRAAAAIPGSGPVIHVVWTEDVTQGEHKPFVLDAQTGATSDIPLRPAEAWYDGERKSFRETQHFVDGSVLETWSNGSVSVDSTAGVGPAAAVNLTPIVRFFGRYEQALESGDATLDGTGTVDGHDVYFLIVDMKEPIYPTGSSKPIPGSDWIERIAIDQQSYEPVAWYVNRDGDPDGGVDHVVKVELIGRDEADLTRPAVTWPETAYDNAGFSHPTSSEQVDRDGAAAWIGHPLVATPDALAGEPFAAARAEVLSPPGDPERRGAMLVYGDACLGAPRATGRYVVVREAPQPEPTYGTMAASDGSRLVVRSFPSDFALCGAKAGDPGSANGYFDGDLLQDSLWEASFERGGLWISVASPTQETTVQAVRELFGS